MSIANRRHVCTGEYLFLLGAAAEQLYVVLDGGLDLCFPLSIGGEMKDVPVETAGVGNVLGWSCLVKPYRFTLSARATQGSEVAAFARRDLLELFESEPRLGYAVMRRVAELVGLRLLQLQAMWARELQRSMALTKPTMTGESR